MLGIICTEINQQNYTIQNKKKVSWNFLKSLIVNRKKLKEKNLENS